MALLDKGVNPVFLTTNTLAAKSWPFFDFSSMPERSFSTLQVIFKYGVFVKFIFNSLPNPDALPVASALR